MIEKEGTGNNSTVEKDPNNQKLYWTVLKENLKDKSIKYIKKSYIKIDKIKS